MLQDAMHQANVAARYLQRLRSTEAFSNFYTRVVKLSAEYTEPPCLARARRPPKWLDSGCNAHTYHIPEDYYRKVYFEVIDILVQELQ